MRQLIKHVASAAAMSALGAAIIPSAGVLVGSAFQATALASSAHQPPAAAFYQIVPFFHGGECTGQEYLNGSCP